MIKQGHKTELSRYIENGWDIREATIPPISDDFFDAFVEDKVRGDNDYVTVDGLIALAHEKGYGGKKTEIIQCPNKENGLTTIVKVTVTGLWYNRYTKQVEVGTWDGIGDCSPSSAPNKFIAVHAIRMAETRALGRALRDYLNIAMLAGEEIGGILEQPSINKGQSKHILLLMSERDYNEEDMQDHLTSVIGRAKLGKDAKEGEAQVLIDWLTAQPIKITEEENDLEEKDKTSEKKNSKSKSTKKNIADDETEEDDEYDEDDDIE